MKIEQKVGYLTAASAAGATKGDPFVAAGDLEYYHTHKCVYMIVPMDCPTPGDEAVDSDGNRFTVGAVLPDPWTDGLVWRGSDGFYYRDCTLCTEPDDSDDSEIMVSLADVRKAVREVAGLSMDEDVANHLRAGASDE